MGPMQVSLEVYRTLLFSKRGWLIWMWNVSHIHFYRTYQKIQTLLMGWIFVF